VGSLALLHQRLWAHCRQSPATLRKRRCKCVTHAHGGLTPAALGRACVCTSQKSFFRRQAFAQQYKSEGRQPPVRTLHGSTTTENHGKPALVQQSPFAAPLDANGLAFVGIVPAVSGTLRKRLCKCITHAHGGLTIAAPGCVFARR
jgi:hypothetical protein